MSCAGRGKRKRPDFTLDAQIHEYLDQSTYKDQQHKEKQIGSTRPKKAAGESTIWLSKAALVSLSEQRLIAASRTLLCNNASSEGCPYGRRIPSTQRDAR